MVCALVSVSFCADFLWTAQFAIYCAIFGFRIWRIFHFAYCVRLYKPSDNAAYTLVRNCESVSYHAILRTCEHWQKMKFSQPPLRNLLRPKP